MATPEARSLSAKIAAHSRWAAEDARAGTERARAAFRRKFELEVDPDGLLDPEERARRADHAIRAHMGRLRLKQTQLRQTRKPA